MIPLAYPMEFYKTFLEWYILQTQAKTYLEIGCAGGGLVQRLKPMLDLAVGVDPGDFEWPEIPGVEWYRCTSDQYFGMPSGAAFDVVLIDGDHSAPQVEKDARLALERLHANGLIVMHDTYPPDKDHLSPSACGTAWEVPYTLRDDLELEVYTFPVTYGVTLVRRQERPPWL